MSSVVDHIAIMVDDLELAEKWYVENVGGEVTHKQENYVRLKLQILTQLSAINHSEVVENDSNEEIGPVLSWNPATGNLQLSQAATQRLLKSLGGRLTNRRDSGITIFFPISELKEFDLRD